MPSATRKRGDIGEEVAFLYLKKHGYKILERNHTNKIGEIDIIAKKHKTIVFVEVKTQYEPEKIGLHPERNVDYKKQQKLIRTAQYYLLQHNYPDSTTWQIDVIGVILDESARKADLRHLKNAVSVD